MPNTRNVKLKSGNGDLKTELKDELTLVGEGIVSYLSQVLQYKIGVTNLSGNVVADSELANFDKFVPAALSAVQSNNHVQLPAGELDENAGWVIPLRHQDRLFGTLLIRGEPAPQDSVVPLAKSLSELLLYQMLVMNRVARENRVLDKFFYDLFENNEPEEKLLRDSFFFNSQFFQIDFAEAKIAALLVLKNFWQEILHSRPILPAEEHKLTAVKDIIRETIEKVLGEKDITVAYLGLDNFALVLPHKPSTETTDKKGEEAQGRYAFSREQLEELIRILSERFNQPAFIGVGQYAPQAQGLIQSYRGAKKTVVLGMKLSPDSRAYYYSDYVLPIMLEQADESLKKEFMESELGELIKHPDLVETLLTHFDSNLNLKKTAYELKIHKNTLYYRLAKIKKILNIDPQEFGQALKLKVALYLWQMQKNAE